MSDEDESGVSEATNFVVKRTRCVHGILNLVFQTRVKLSRAVAATPETVFNLTEHGHLPFGEAPAPAHLFPPAARKRLRSAAQQVRSLFIKNPNGETTL